MFPLIGGLLSGGASLLSGFLSSTTSASNVQAQIAAQQQAQGQAEQFSAGQAQVARDYETQMSNTAYQRASQDMQKAGLNPMMMFGSGGAASTPGSPSPSIGAQQIPIGVKSNPLAGVGDAVSKAVSTAVDAETVNRMVQEVANLRTQQRLTGAQITTEAQRPELIAAQATLDQILGKLRTLDVPTAKVGATESQGVMDVLGPTGVKAAGVAKYGAGAAADVVGPLVNSALRLKGLGMLRKAFDAQEAAKAAH